MLNRSLLKIVVCSIALCAASLLANAQVREINHDFSSFDSIDVDYEFNVKVESSRRNYSISMTVDDILADYVQTYVKGHTLYITLDKKSLPSDIKKLYKGRKSAEPILNATVYVPESLSSVKLSGSSVLSIDDEVEVKDFDIVLKETARIRKLTLDATNVTVSMDNKSVADMEIFAENITISTSGSASASIGQSSEHLVLKPAGSSEIIIDGETLNAEINASGSSKTTIKGKTDVLNVVGSGMSNIDAINCTTPEAIVKLSGSCKLTEAASEKLSIELSGNSSLVFDGEPAVDIISIKSSTVTRYENVSSKKK